MLIDPVSAAFTPSETTLFQATLACATSYAEWGCGGSTVLAAQIVPGIVSSIDSSSHWIAAVRRSLGVTKPDVLLRHIDIGPIGAFGYPRDERTRDRWPDYHKALRYCPADLVLIDGRFRVACALQILLTSPADTPIIVHDYDVPGRDHYRQIDAFARVIAKADRLALFIRRPDFDQGQAQQALADVAYDPR